jgi:hypothetical protein
MEEGTMSIFMPLTLNEKMSKNLQIGLAQRGIGNIRHNSDDQELGIVLVALKRDFRRSWLLIMKAATADQEDVNVDGDTYPGWDIYHEGLNKALQGEKVDFVSMCHMEPPSWWGKGTGINCTMLRHVHMMACQIAAAAVTGVDPFNVQNDVRFYFEEMLKTHSRTEAIKKIVAPFK